MGLKTTTAQSLKTTTACLGTASFRLWTWTAWTRRSVHHHRTLALLPCQPTRTPAPRRNCTTSCTTGTHYQQWTALKISASLRLWPHRCSCRVTIPLGGAYFRPTPAPLKPAFLVLSTYNI